jgi:hypothetical protein
MITRETDRLLDLAKAVGLRSATRRYPYRRSDHEEGVVDDSRSDGVRSRSVVGPPRGQARNHTVSMWEGDRSEAGSRQPAGGGRVYYLSGDTERAEAIFSRYTGASKPAAGDLVRIARVYAQALEHATKK